MLSTLLSGRLAVGQRTSVQGGGEGAVRVPEPHGVQGQQVLALGYHRTSLDTTEDLRIKWGSQGSSEHTGYSLWLGLAAENSGRPSHRR